VHPGQHAASTPDRIAAVMAGTGDAITYGELDAASNRLAHLFLERGLRRGSHIAVLLGNELAYFEVVWAAQRSGMYVTPINWHLGAEEAGYIIEDCDAEVLVTSTDFAPLVEGLGAHLQNVHTRLVVRAEIDGFELLAEATAGLAPTPIEGETEGAVMFYSSGTTGRPKGIKQPLSGAEFGTGTMIEGLMRGLYAFDEESIYLCPAPLYHAAPLGWSMGTQRIGGTVVVMERFDPNALLSAVEYHSVSHAQFVPTHFVRMLKLSDAERAAHDLASLRVAIHAAAPCPVEVKQQMFDWWGPIIYEYYSGSEGLCFCAVSPQEWLEHPGTVGRPVAGTVHVVGEDGQTVAPGEVGELWFATGAHFEYHKDPEKTRSVFNDQGWGTLGDVGYVDEDGWVFLTDRVSHMIISGGVNIYPQEIENVLVLHPAVSDVAVIGVADEDMGEAVKAVVQPTDPTAVGAQLADELMAYCRAHLAGFKCPRSVDFVAELPRLPTGKLLKRKLRDAYATGEIATL
jgi:long-chain acyl-CoA synthetase